MKKKLSKITSTDNTQTKKILIKETPQEKKSIEKTQVKRKSSLWSTIAIAYFMIGFVVAILFALYYRWTYLAFFSPGFYSVIITWPLQSIGFLYDLINFGLAGKPLPI